MPKSTAKSQESPKPAPVPRRKRRWLRLILLLALLMVTLLMVGIRTGKLHRIAIRWAEEAASRAGILLKIGHLQGGLFSPLTLHQVLVQGPEQKITIEKSDVKLQWIRFFARNDPSQRGPIGAVEMQGVQVEWNVGSPPKIKDRPPAEDFTRWLPASLLVHDALVEVRHEGHDIIRIEGLHLEAATHTSGMVQAANLTVNAGEFSKTFTGLRGTSAWKNGVFYLGGVELEPDWVLTRLSADLSRLGRGRNDVEFQIDAGEGSVRGELSLQKKANGEQVDATCWMWKLSLAQCAKFLGTTQKAGGLINEAKFTFRGNPAYVQGAEMSLWISAEDFLLHERAFESLVAGATMSGRRLQLYRFDLRQSANFLSLAGEMDVPKQLPKNVEEVLDSRLQTSVALKAQDLERLAMLFGSGVDRLKGKAILEGVISSEEGRLEGDLRFEGSEIFWREVPFESAMAKLHFHGSELQIQDIVIRSASDLLSGSAMVELRDTRRYSGKLQLKVEDLARFAPLLDQWAAKVPLKGNIQAEWSGDGTMKTHSGAFEVKTTALRLPLRGGGESLPLDGEFVGTYSPDSLYVRKFQLAHEQTILSAAITVGERILSAQEINLSHAGKPWLQGDLYLPIDLPRAWREKKMDAVVDADGKVYAALTGQNLELQEVFKLTGRTVPLQGRSQLRITAEGTPSALTFAGEATVDGLMLTRDKPGKWADSSLTVSLKATELQADLKGALRMKGFEPSLFEASLPLQLRRTIADGAPFLDPERTLAGQLKLPRASLEAFRPFLPPISILDGRISGFVSLTGLPEKPQLGGVVELSGGKFQLKEDAPEIDAISARLLFAGDRVVVDALRGEIASGPFLLTGSMSLTDPARPELDLKLTGDKVLLVRNDSIRIRANPRLTITGPLATAVVRGEVDLVDGRLSRRIEVGPLLFEPPIQTDFNAVPPPFRMPVAPLRDWTFEVRVRNATPFEIGTSIGRGTIDPDLTLHGTGDAPYFVGTIAILGGRASLPFAELQIGSGTITFPESNPTVPDLDIRATSNVQGYAVRAFVRGPLDRKRIYLRSDPPLPEESIASLLATGLAPDQLHGDGSNRALIGRGGILLLRSLVQQVNPNSALFADESFFDRLAVNVLPPTGRGSEERIESSFKINEPFSLEAERDSWGDFNLGLRYTLRFR